MWFWRLPPVVFSPNNSDLLFWSEHRFWKSDNHTKRKRRAPENDDDPFNQLFFNFHKQFKCEKDMIGKSVHICGLFTEIYGSFMDNPSILTVFFLWCFLGGGRHVMLPNLPPRMSNVMQKNKNIASTLKSRNTLGETKQNGVPPPCSPPMNPSWVWHAFKH